MTRKALYLFAILSLVSGCASYRSEPTYVPPPVTVPAPAPATRSERSEALLQALLALGMDYKYGGKSPETGFDCSGLVAHIYKEAWGIRLPLNAKGQSEVGVPVAVTELQAGDLVFYDTMKRPYSHVGIYMGDGKFVHSPKTGAQVRIESLQSAYWSRRFNGARRIELGT